jgi:hypothetical protein
MTAGALSVLAIIIAFIALFIAVMVGISHWGRRPR